MPVSTRRLATGAAEFTQGELGAFFNNATGKYRIFLFSYAESSPMNDSERPPE
jgi:hypothetical protein